MRILTLAFPVVFLSALAIGGCGNGDHGLAPDERPPAVFLGINVIPAYGTLTQIGQVDTFGVLLNGTGVQSSVVPESKISWAGSDPAVFTVDTTGIRGAVVTAVANGSGVLRAVEQLSGLTDSAIVMVSQIPRLLEIVSGSDQEGKAGSKLPNPVVVRVTDFGGTAVTGVTVSFAPEDGAGSVDPDSAVSDAEGLVSTGWTLGAGPGDQSIRIWFEEGPLLWVRAKADS